MQGTTYILENHACAHFKIFHSVEILHSKLSPACVPVCACVFVCVCVRVRLFSKFEK